MTKLMGLAVLLTMGIGLACAFLVSFGLAQPVAQLSKELVDAQEQRKAVPEFSVPASGSWTGWRNPS